MAQTLKFGNKVWAAKEDSVLAYNDINNNYKPLPFDFARASIGTRVNKDGLIETMGQDIARIDYSDSSDGVLLLEPSSTNLINYSQAISNSPVKSGAFVDNFAISPDGTQNATKLTAQNTDPYFYQNITFAAASYTSSIYVKGIGDSIGKDFRISIGSFTTAPKLVIPSEWTRFEFTAILPSGTQSTGLEITDPAIVGDEVLVWGWQVEQSSYATSYIPTSGSTVTRAAETCNNSGNSEVFNDSEGVLFLDIKIPKGSTEVKQTALCNGTTSEAVKILQLSGSTTFRFETVMSSGTNFQKNLTLNPYQINKCALQYKANDYKVFVNGFKHTVTQRGTVPVNLDRFNFNRGISAADNFYGKTKEVGYYDTALTDLELETLTSYRNWVSMVNELNLNIIYNG